MPPRAVRPVSDREADRQKISELAVSMRDDIAKLQAAIAALPTPATRNAAQQRDALIMRSQIRTIRWCLITSGAGTAADRNDEPA